ncbi:MAG: serine protein kinase RIO [Thermoprotei archaeon]|nr:MAG: serine protein kinase RIO [Thermoprotei archaeon]
MCNERITPVSFEEVEDRVERIRREKRVKDSRLFEVVEEVFDYPTLMALYKLINDGVIGVMHGAVAAGKEARIYWAETPRGEDIAVKIFLVQAAEFRRGRLVYIEGDPRFRRVRRDLRGLIELWCSKEFRNLRRAHEAGVRVPRPYARRGNVLVMEFVSDPEVRGRPAPLLKEVELEDPEEAFNVIKGYIEQLYLKARLVHADLSEYNVMVRGEELILIDFGSAVDVAHPMAKEFLRRDIRNIYAYFKRLGVDVGDPDEFYHELTASEL